MSLFEDYIVYIAPSLATPHSSLVALLEKNGAAIALSLTPKAHLFLLFYCPSRFPIFYYLYLFKSDLTVDCSFLFGPVQFLSFFYT